MQHNPTVEKLGNRTRAMTTTGSSAKRQDIEFHYDVGDDFYQLWLDPEMNYSAALWDGVDDLASAQEQKNAFHLDVINARAAQRILDVGCGWGALLRSARALSPRAELVGLTLSSTQRKHCAESLPGAQIRLESWEHHTRTAPYDAIVSVGALEHFVNHRMTRIERIQTYASFFRFCRDSMTPRGRLSLQTIGYGDLPGGKLDPFIYESIFPNSDLPFLDELVTAAHGILEIMSLRNDRHDYAQTCAAWAERLTRRVEQAVEVTSSADLVSNYIRYLKMSAAGFRAGSLALYRLSLTPYPQR
jgi:cyclopropane-fatty-acyl-phospholipid synthase